MYWPLGAPRVYAASRRRRNTSTTKVAEEDEDEEAPTRSEPNEDALLGLCVSRNGHLFATITNTTLYIWQTLPVTVLCSIERSKSSLESYGNNTSVLLRPDSSIAAIQTSLGYLVTYTIQIDQESRVYQQIRTDEKSKRLSIAGRLPTDPRRLGQKEVHIRFCMVIKIDAGIGKALALDDELIVATEKPAAVQCIRWIQEENKSQTSTELMKTLPWMGKSNLVEIVQNRQMNLFVWITNDGRAFAVQKLAEGAPRVEGQGKFFKGHALHAPKTKALYATKAAVNARFSLVAVGCANGQVHIYAAKDYAGSLPISHKCIAPYSIETTGALTCLSYSPDGYCLFAGYQKGWIMWSVYGKMGGSSFTSELEISRDNDEGWLMGAHDAVWINGGTRIMFTTQQDGRIWVLKIAKNAMTSCFGPSNVSRTLLHTDSELLIYRGHDSKNITSLSSDVSLWNTVKIPSTFLQNQSPIRAAVISPDGRYIAVAGKRGLAHYSVQSGRWKTFDSLETENSFAVRGGMFWYQHILITAVETDRHDELRLYSREMPLNESKIVYIEPIPAPIVTITPSGDDSLLVYTYENNLYHYVINTSNGSLQLVQFGAIGLHGIVRAPARVRAVTWYVPEHQLIDGDPAQDVMQASVLFLVDAKFVLLQPTKDDKGELRYDMKIIANDVEFFSFTRDQISPRNASKLTPSPQEIQNGSENGSRPAIGLIDSLWYFDGQNIQCWPDIQDLLRAAIDEPQKDTPPVAIPVDFYPTSIALAKAVVVGLEPDLIQRRDTPFALFRVHTRTQLFFPPILRHSIATSDATSALSLCHHYQRLPYFSHALEVLLHTVLDDEVDSHPSEPEALLPSVLSFLSSFPDYLDILVQCTRKTEVRSWKTLFKTLPSPRDLFHESLQKGELKTAGGYLLVLHTLEEDESSSQEAIDLLRRAKNAGDWGLCKELARFLVALDPGGDTLREAMESLTVDGATTPNVGPNGRGPVVTQLKVPRARNSTITQENAVETSEEEFASSPGNSSESNSHYEGARDYFSSRGSGEHGPL